MCKNIKITDNEDPEIKYCAYCNTYTIHANFGAGYRCTVHELPH